MPREPLYPHMPKKREPLYPHRPRSQFLPQVTIEGGEMVSPEYRHLVGLVSEPLPKEAE